MLGIALILPSVFLLSLDPKDDKISENNELDVPEMEFYGILAVLMAAVLAPIVWTIKTYQLRAAMVERPE